MAPEIKLLFQLATSGMMIHMSNTAKVRNPGNDDIMRQIQSYEPFHKGCKFNATNCTSLSNFMNDFGMSHSEDTNEIRSRRAFPPIRTATRAATDKRGASSCRAAPPQQRPTRPEMKGPDNINSILDKINLEIQIDTIITAQYLRR